MINAVCYPWMVFLIIKGILKGIQRYKACTDIILGANVSGDLAILVFVLWQLCGFLL